MASYTNFACRASGDNRNAGTRTGSTAEPGTSPDFAYASGSWVSATGVFTVAGGSNPSSDGVAVGDFASVFADGATATTLVGRVTAVTSTTITVSTTVKAGTTTDGTSNRTLRIGGAWLGPNGSTPWFDTFPGAAMTNAAGDPVFVHLKNDQTYSIAGVITLGTGDCTNFAGYASSYGDGGRAILDGGTSGASYTLLAIGASVSPTRVQDIEFRNNGASGSASGVTHGGGSAEFVRCVFRDFRGHGLASTGTALRVSECEFYGANQSNTANLGGLNASTAALVENCHFHDNVGSNNFGARFTGAVAIAVIDSVFDTNGSSGGMIASGSITTTLVAGCDFYNNAGPGVNLSGGARIKNCNFLKNGTYGVLGNSSFVAHLLNCGFGSGTQANASGDTSGKVEESGTVAYAADVAPWADPANGDFTITLDAAKGSGRGAFLQTATGYAGTTATVDIGAGQSAASGGIHRRRARTTGA